MLIDYEPLVRFGHSTEKVGDHLYMWGGWQPGLPEVHDNEKKKAMTALMDVYHLPTGTWEQKPTNGSPPLGVRASASVVIGCEIFYFGGYCGHPECYHNSVHSFNVDTFNWRELSPSSSDRCPMMKGYCGMVGVHFNGEDYLVIIGGRGSYSNRISMPKQRNAQYSAGGICNEIHYYNILSGQY